MQPVPCLRISEKDQLGFLVTKILGGDSLIHKQNKDPETNRGSPRPAREGATTDIISLEA